MMYAREVISLLGAYPHRSFAMRHIVNHIHQGADGRQRQRIRVGVLRVLQSLTESGLVVVEDKGTSSSVRYRWFNSKQSDT